MINLLWALSLAAVFGPIGVGLHRFSKLLDGNDSVWMSPVHHARSTTIKSILAHPEERKAAFSFRTDVRIAFCLGLIGLFVLPVVAIVQTVWS